MGEDLNHIEESQILAYLNGEPMDSKELQLVEAWLGSAENKQKAREIHQLWEMSVMSAPSKADAGASWDRVATKIGNTRQHEPKKSRHIIWYAVAASVVLVMAYFWIGNEAKQPVELLVASESEKKDLQLVDGTSISLNKDSELRYVADELVSAPQRVVKLSGEAYFDVERDVSRPFLIHTHDAQIEVLGTAFLVQSYPGEKTQVSVTEGSVQVTFLVSGEQLILKAAQQIKEQDEQVVVEELDENRLYWKTGVIEFHGSLLHEVFSTLEEEFGEKIVVANPAINDCSLSATFKKQGFDTIIDVIVATHGLKRTKGDGVVIIDGDGCD